MHATRVLRSPSAVKGFNIPPRSTWDILKSAGNACLSLLSQEKRDDFVDTLNKGIINPQVLAQADMGAAMILSLYNDLHSPLFSKYRFKIEDFIEGAKPALERFHDVQACVQNELYERKDLEGNKVNEEKDEDVLKVENGNDGKDRVKNELEKLGSEIIRLEKDLQQKLELNWRKQAKEDQDSLAGQLMAMVTPEYFDVIENFSRTNFLLDRELSSAASVLGRKYRYIEGSGEISNMALMSARAKVVERNMEIADQNEPDNKVSKDQELSVDPPVVAQVEVLYDINQTFAVNSSGKNDSDASKGNEGAGEETVTRTTILVGVFEGWLNGDPEGHTDLRWKLALNRPAWEFPTVTSTHM